MSTPTSSSPRFQRLKGPIQDQVAQAFGEAGPNAALAMAESFVKSLSDQTGISPEAVRNLLGLGDMTLKIKIAIEQTEIEKANAPTRPADRPDRGDDRRPSRLRLALEAGTIDRPGGAGADPEPSAWRWRHDPDDARRARHRQGPGRCTAQVGHRRSRSTSRSTRHRSPRCGLAVQPEGIRRIGRQQHDINHVPRCADPSPST